MIQVSHMTAWALLWFMAAQGLAGTTALAEAPAVSHARLVGGAEAIRPGQPFWIAVHIELDDGWHTYWRNPGDSGARPLVEWRLPAGMEAEPIFWPYPSLFREGPLVIYGYKENAWLFTRVIAPAEAVSAGSVTIGADLEWLVCRDICIPQYAQLSLSVPLAFHGESGALAPDFAKALADVPQRSPGPAFYKADAETFILSVEALTIDAANVWFFPYVDGVIEPAASQQMRHDDRGLHLRMHRVARGGDLPERVAGALVIRDNTGQRAYEIIAFPASIEDVSE